MLGRYNIFIIEDGDIKIMSAIIGICGTNFCSFIANKRMVTNKFHSPNQMVVENEDFQKIFKINENMLFGCTGYFNKYESLFDPLRLIGLNTVNLESIRNACVTYLERYQSTVQNRTYLIGEKKEKNWNDLLKMVMKYMETAERMTLSKCVKFILIQKQARSRLY